MIGHCLCCNAQRMVEADTVMQANASATAACGCAGAQRQRTIMQTEQAIDSLFSDEMRAAGYASIDEDAQRAVHHVAQMINAGHVQDASIRFPDGSKITMREGRDGFEAARERKNKNTVQSERIDNETMAAYWLGELERASERLEQTDE